MTLSTASAAPYEAPAYLQQLVRPRMGEIRPIAGPGGSAVTEAERAFIRRGICQGFGTGSELAQGIPVPVRRTGPQAGQPKLPKAMLSLTERGLIEIPPRRTATSPLRAYFTPAGLEALRTLLRDERGMNPLRFAHLRRELGLDPP